MTPQFTFEAMLSYNKNQYQKFEVEAVLSFLKDFTVKINEANLSSIKHKGAILN